MHTLTDTIIHAGYLAFFITIFAESGFLLGFFLPGESLLFTLGVLASKGSFNIWILIILAIVAAILGDTVGYWTGNYFGPKLFNKDDSLLFKKKYVLKTQRYYDKYGNKTIILARFVPIVRTFAPIMGGVGSMHYRKFLLYNVIGGIVWATSFLWLSYYIGSQVPGTEHYLSYIILGIILISIFPILIELYIQRTKSN